MSAKPQGALDGKPFFRIEHSIDIGRRGSSSALPFSEKGAAGADVGRKPRKYSMSLTVLSVVGDQGTVAYDHRAMRDDLMAVIEAPGPHLLTHPDIGRKSVWIWDAKVTERSDERGKATISFVAEEAFDQPATVPSPDTGAAVRYSGTQGINEVSRSFSNPLTGLKRLTNDFVAAAHLSVLDDVLVGLASVNGIIANLLSVPSGFASQIDGISRRGAQLLNTPDLLFNEIEGTLAVLAESARRIGKARQDIDIERLDPMTLSMRPGRALTRTVRAIAGLGMGVPPPPPINTATRRDQAAGALALQRHFQAAGLLHWAMAAADVEYDSQTDAAAARDALVRALTELAESEPDMTEEIAAALRNTAAGLSAHLTAALGALPKIVEYTPVDTLPAEVIAWHLYGDAGRAEEIVVGNLALVPHPTFVPGGHVLHVRGT